MKLVGTILALVLLPFIGTGTVSAQSASDSTQTHFTDAFDMTICDFATNARNPYFVLEPGYQLTLKGIDEGDSATLVITVLKETLKVDGVETRIVEERESVGGELVEVSRNFFAYCEKTGDVFYFGEDVDMYEDGEVTGHGGAWRAGVDSAHAGIMIPGRARIGDAYYQEIAPGIAMDRAKVISTSSHFECPAGKFDGCLITEETSPLEPDARERKIYAPGIGLVKDGPLVLVAHGKSSTK